jgi:hypothetical protein
MILVTHAIAGAAAAELFPSNPIAAFIAAFLSHFVLDAIPHWNYTVKSHKKNPDDPLNGEVRFGKDLVIDLFKVFLDLLSGVALAFLFFSKGTYQSETIVLLGAFGGMFPDALQFAYWLFKIEPLKSLQRFHVWVHHKTEWQLSAAWGIPIQIVTVIAIIVAASKFL